MSVGRLPGGQSGADVLLVTVEGGERYVVKRSTSDREPAWMALLDAACDCDDVRVAPPLRSQKGQRIFKLPSGYPVHVEPFLAGRPTLCKRLDEVPSVLAAVCSLHRIWRERPVKHWEPRIGRSPVVGERLGLLERASGDVRFLDVRRELTRWATRRLPLQPIWRDVWYGNVLLRSGQPPALVDAAAACIDHVAVDFARLFGSLPTGSPEGLSLAERDEEALALQRSLERSGVLLAWHRWQRRPPHPLRERRLEELSHRLDDLFP